MKKPERELRQIIRESIREIEDEKPRINEACQQMMSCADGYSWVQSACNCLTSHEEIMHIINSFDGTYSSVPTTGGEAGEGDYEAKKTGRGEEPQHVPAGKKRCIKTMMCGPGYVWDWKHCMCLDNRHWLPLHMREGLLNEYTYCGPLGNCDGACSYQCPSSVGNCNAGHPQSSGHQCHPMSIDVSGDKLSKHTTTTTPPKGIETGNYMKEGSINESFTCGSLTCAANEKCSYGCPSGCNDCNHSSPCTVNHACVSSTGPSNVDIKKHANIGTVDKSGGGDLITYYDVPNV
jgi:hypothetical protein